MGTSSYNFSIQQLYGCGKECFFSFLKIVKMKKMPLYWKNPDFLELLCFR